jgi:multiple sugar transport system substrate-binding protein
MTHAKRSTATRRTLFGGAVGWTGGALLAACSPGAPAGAPGAGPSGRAPVSVLFWCRENQEDYEKLQAPMKEWRKRNPHVSIVEDNVEMTDAQFSTKLLAAFASGSPPDAWWNATRWVRPWHAAGGVADLTQYYARAKITADRFYGNSIEELEIDGKIWGVPQGWGIGLLGINKNVFRAAGVELKPDFDKTWTNEQFVDMLKRVARSDDTGNLGTWGIDWGTGLTTATPLLWAFGADLLDKDKKKAVINSLPGSVQAFQWWHDLTHVYRVQPRRTGADRPQGVNMWNSGRQALNGNAGPNVLHQWATLDYEWDVVLRPIGPRGRNHRFYSNAYYMAKDGRVKDAAWDYLSFAGTEGMRYTEEAGGYNIPGYRQVADTIWLTKKTATPVTRQRWLEAAKDGKAQPLVVKWDDMGSIVSKHMADLWDQKIPAKMAVENIDREVTTLLSS